MVTIFIPELPEFLPLVTAARQMGTCNVVEPHRGYWRLKAESEITFERKLLGLGPALCNSAMTGGFRGRIVEYDRNVMRIESEAP